MTGEELVSFDEMATMVAGVIDAARFAASWNRAVGETYMGGAYPDPTGPMAAVAKVMDPDGGLLVATEWIAMVLAAPTPEEGVRLLKIEIAKVMIRSTPEIEASASAYVIQEEP